MLKKLFDKYLCDKGSDKHKYYKEYSPYMEPKREESLNFLEIGTFKGASTRAFNEYFPNGNIYTIDTFERIDPTELNILNTDRVHWMQADSMDTSLVKKMRDKWGQDIKFDFIIDDGAHWPRANRLTLENLFPLLKDDGTYFIEDVHPLHLLTKEQLRTGWIRRHPDRYDMSEHKLFMETLENYETTHYDRRHETRQGDTYIIAIKKK